MNSPSLSLPVKLKRILALSTSVSFPLQGGSCLPNQLLGLGGWNIVRKGGGEKNKKMCIWRKTGRVTLGGRLLRKTAVVYEDSTLETGTEGILSISGDLWVPARCLRKQKCWFILKLFLDTYVLFGTESGRS